MSSIAVLHASQLVTLAGPKRPRVGRELSELAIIPDGGMLIGDGKIDIVGPSTEIEKKAGNAQIIDAHGKVVLPGFVDAHTHLVFAGNRLDDFERRVRGVERGSHRTFPGARPWMTRSCAKTSSPPRSG